MERFGGMLSGEIKVKVQDSAAVRFAEIAYENFGVSGGPRPAAWAKLSKDYADEFHDGSRIPTGILSGEMRDTIDVDRSEQPERAIVVAPAPYAYEQHFGNSQSNLPARPFFPIIGETIDESEITPYAEALCLQNAQETLEAILAET